MRTTLKVHQVGQDVWRQKQRKDIDPVAKRQLRIFQLGWRTLRRAANQVVAPAITLCIRPMRLAAVLYLIRTRAPPRWIESA
jgi:hypothetical protein